MSKGPRISESLLIVSTTYGMPFLPPLYEILAVETRGEPYLNHVSRTKGKWDTQSGYFSSVKLRT